MQHFYDDLIQHLDTEVDNLTAHVCSRVLQTEDYAKLIGTIEAYRRIRVRVEDDYNNWRSGQ